MLGVNFPWGISGTHSACSHREKTWKYTHSRTGVNYPHSFRKSHQTDGRWQREMGYRMIKEA